MGYLPSLQSDVILVLDFRPGQSERLACAQVQWHIKAKWKVPTGKLEELLPLDWGNQVAGAGSTYKEPWQPGNCAKSLAKERLYEAAGSLFWLSAIPDGAATAADIRITYDMVVQAKTSFLQPQDINCW